MELKEGEKNKHQLKLCIVEWSASWTKESKQGGGTRTIDDVALAKSLWVMVSEDTDNFTRNGNARVLCHGRAREIDNDA